MFLSPNRARSLSVAASATTTSQRGVQDCLRRASDSGWAACAVFLLQVCEGLDACIWSVGASPMKTFATIGNKEQDDIWDDASDDPITREWTHRKNQFHKVGYRDGITEGQKDSAQEGFSYGFRQSVQDGHKRGRVRGITSAFASLPDSLGEKLMPDAQCRGELQDLHSSVQEISADDALQLFQNCIAKMNTCPGEEQQMTSEVERAEDNGTLGN